MAAETIQDIRDKAKAIADSVEITENQKKALLEAAEAAAKLKVATTAISVGQKAVNTIFSESVEALNTLEGAQVTLAATIGQQAVPAVETARNVFNEFNLAVRGI